MIPWRNPHWNLEKKLPRWSDICLYMYLSWLFEIFGKILTGLQFSFEYLEPFLKRGVIWASLSAAGNVDE